MRNRFNHYLKGFNRGFNFSWGMISAIYYCLEYHWLLAYPFLLYALFNAYLADEEAKQ